MTTRRDHLAIAAGILALVVAGIHLYWGLPRFAVYVTVWSLADPRPFAFVLSGHAIAGAITLVGAGVLDRRKLYIPGMALMVVHLGGYVAWHTVLAHGVGGGTPHEHLTLLTALPIVLEDLWRSPLPLAAKAAEVALLVLLGWLFVTNDSG